MSQWKIELLYLPPASFLYRNRHEANIPPASSELVSNIGLISLHSFFHSQCCEETKIEREKVFNQCGPMGVPQGGAVTTSVLCIL